MVSGDSLRLETSKGIPELVPRRVLGLVAGFHHDKGLGSGLVRTGMTGRRDRSDRCHGRISRTGLTGLMDRSDRWGVG